MHAVRISKSGKAGISLPELLFLGSILLFLLSITVPAYLTVRNRQLSRIGYAQLKVLLKASTQLNTEYRLWPTYKAPENGDVQYGENLPNKIVMNILTGVNGEGNEEHKTNPLQINFIDMVSSGGTRLEYNEAGEVIDPWGSPYQFVFDADYDNICSILSLAQGRVFGTGVAIWSYGPDRISDSKDDLRTWSN